MSLPWSEVNADYERAVEDIALDLERAAKEIRRRGLSIHNDLRDMKADYAEAACDVVSTVTSLLGNLGLRSLVLRASRADRAVRQ
jgi:hypothetical protein